MCYRRSLSHIFMVSEREYTHLELLVGFRDDEGHGGQEMDEEA